MSTPGEAGVATDPETYDPGDVVGAGTTVRPRRRQGAWIAGAVGIVLLILVAILAKAPSASETKDGGPLVGKPAPALVAKDLDGRPFDLAALRGRYVLVNFFASWCVPCEKEHPQLLELAQRHASAGDLQIVGVLFQDDPADARRFFAERGGSWPLIEDRDAIADFGVRGPPESFLIARDGTILYKRVGPATASDWETLLSQAKAKGY